MRERIGSQYNSPITSYVVDVSVVPSLFHKDWHGFKLDLVQNLANLYKTEGIEYACSVLVSFERRSILRLLNACTMLFSPLY